MLTYTDSGRNWFYTMITNQNYLVSGWKKKRYDSVVAKTFRLNYLIGLLETSGVQLNDFNTVD
jgi:hypothetical protein